MRTKPVSDVVGVASITLHPYDRLERRNTFHGQTISIFLGPKTTFDSLNHEFLWISPSLRDMPKHFLNFYNLSIWTAGGEALATAIFHPSSPREAAFVKAAPSPFILKTVTEVVMGTAYPHVRIVGMTLARRGNYLT